MSEELDSIKKKEFGKIQESIGHIDDPILLVLKAHLYSEFLLERIILGRLQRGDRVIEKAKLTYFQKLALVDSFDCLPDWAVSSLRNLSKLRNQCSHELSKDIAEIDVTRIGSPLGKKFTEFKNEQGATTFSILLSVLQYNLGALVAQCYISEKDN